MSIKLRKHEVLPSPGLRVGVQVGAGTSTAREAVPTGKHVVYGLRKPPFFIS